MIVSQIAACAKNSVIGLDGDLPWDLPEDLKFFRDKTKGHIIIMGRKTFDAFEGRTLPQRLHIVISRTPDQVIIPNDQVIAVGSLQEALKLSETYMPAWPEEVFVIGGGEIYQQALVYTDKIYLTEIQHDIEGDAWYPMFSSSEFKLVDSSPRTEPFPFSFNVYKRLGPKQKY